MPHFDEVKALKSNHQNATKILALTDKIPNLPPPKTLIRRIFADTFLNLISLAADHLPPREVLPV